MSGPGGPVRNAPWSGGGAGTTGRRSGPEIFLDAKEGRFKPQGALTRH
jgi:hypothetical protein